MRTRYRYDHALGQVVEITAGQPEAQKGPFVLRDINSAYKDGGIHSPIDGSFITSRSQLRRHNNTHNVRCAGDFKPGELIAKERARVEANRQRAKGGSVEWK